MNQRYDDQYFPRSYRERDPERGERESESSSGEWQGRWSGGEPGSEGHYFGEDRYGPQGYGQQYGPGYGARQGYGPRYGQGYARVGEGYGPRRREWGGDYGGSERWRQRAREYPREPRYGGGGYGGGSYSRGDYFGEPRYSERWYGDYGSRGYSARGYGGYGGESRGHYGDEPRRWGGRSGWGEPREPRGWAEPRGGWGESGGWSEPRESHGEERPGFFRRLFNRGPKGYQRSDERIREDISEQLMLTSDVDSSDVSVTVVSGKVTLEGTVPSRYMKHRIEDIADACPGVQDIDNRIRVATGGTLAQAAASQISSGQGGMSTQSGAPGSSSVAGANGGRRKE
ncbi:MAG: BON domain-containing protein [Steroidobacteraceae bacterium]|nr:BON domain-containing protein [Steroidobacteraceae bacterium]